MTMKPTRQLEREHGLANGSIAYWIQAGLIPTDAIQEPTGKGRPRLVEETAVLGVIAKGYGRRQPQKSRSVVVMPGPGHKGPAITIEPQVIRPGAAITTIEPPLLPETIGSTVELIQAFLDMRKLNVERGDISIKTWKTEEYYLRLWALHAPVFPWTQRDIDTYDTTWGTMPSRWHAMRYVKTVTRWAEKRYPGIQLPQDIDNRSQKPPRHDVHTDEEVNLFLAAFRAYSYPLWVYSMALLTTGCRSFELQAYRFHDKRPSEKASRSSLLPGRPLRYHHEPA
jgi:hypothetical protein